MIVQKTNIEGVRVSIPKVFEDERGFFLETYHSERYAESGIPPTFVQDNHSHSKTGVLRGFHYQNKNQQAQLIHISSGSIMMALLDVRVGSPTFSFCHVQELSAENHHQVYMPPGVASAFYVTGDHADVHYKVTRFYDPSVEGGVLWSDPDIEVTWPTDAPLVGERDANYPRLCDIPRQLLPNYNSLTTC